MSVGTVSHFVIFIIIIIIIKRIFFKCRAVKKTVTDVGYLVTDI